MVCVELQDALHVGFVHGEVDRAGGAQRGDGLLLRQAESLGRLREFHAGEFRMRLGPGDQDAAGERDAVRAQYGGGGGIGIAIEAHALAFAGFGEQRQRFHRTSEVVRTHDLMVRNDHRHADFAADAKGLLHGFDDAVVLDTACASRSARHRP